MTLVRNRQQRLSGSNLRQEEIFILNQAPS
jgi:hypothetical protein